MPPDDYKLLVRCSDGYGGWSDAAVMNISVSPFFYKTIWFYMFVMVLIVLLVIWIFKFRTRSLNEQKRLLSMLVEQRTEELRQQKVQLEEKTAVLERQNVTLVEQNKKITQQKEDILDMNDLQVGMILNGVVRNVIDFGAFVDIGVHQDGLVHISELSDRFVKHPSEVVSVNDQVKVRVLAVDVKKKRISLSMKNVK